MRVLEVFFEDFEKVFYFLFVCREFRGSAFGGIEEGRDSK